MPQNQERRSILLGLTGLHIDGGIASVNRCIVRALDEQIAAGKIDRADRVLLLDTESESIPAPRSGQQWFSRGSKARFVWQLWSAFRHHRHDVVFFDLLGLARTALLPLPPFPPHDTAIFVHGIELSNAKTGRRAESLARASTLLTNSEFTAEALRLDHPSVSEQIRVTPLCIDPDRVSAWESLRSDSPDLVRSPAALLVGRMWSEERGKGHDQLIAAWINVRAKIPNAELWIVGDGDDRPRLEQLARSLGVADAIRFLGRVPDAELFELYRGASVFAMPSRQEGFGLVYAEAMWHGLPCIGSTADAAGQVIKDGETGILVPYGDVEALGNAVVRLLNDPTQACRMGQAGRRRATEYFSYERFRRDLLAALGLG